ncbi:MAG: rRNA maturation RNase YbeY [Betaproteobacteria bacterium]
MAPGDPHERRSVAGRPLNVLVGDERGRPVRAGGLGAWLARVAPARARGTVSIALVSDARVRALNRRYRRRDHATDVLSFPAVQPPTPRSRASSPEPPVLGPQPPFLGDIVIATGVARRQAREAGHSARTELRVLALHGLLHLLGYDHEGGGGPRMARFERTLRRRGGLREGLIERSETPASGQRAGGRSRGN